MIVTIIISNYLKNINYTFKNLISFIFQLHDNPFRCDCRLVEFAHWLQNSGIPRSVEPTCYSPKRLAGKLIINVSISNLACLPQVEPAATLYSGTSSDTLLTLVQDDILKDKLDTCKFYKKNYVNNFQHNIPIFIESKITYKSYFPCSLQKMREYHLLLILVKRKEKTEKKKKAMSIRRIL